MKSILELLAVCSFVILFNQCGKGRILSGYNANELAVYNKNGFYGIIHKTDSIVQPAIFDSIYKFEKFCYSKNCQCFIAKSGDHYRFITNTGSQKPAILLDSVKMLRGYENSRYAGFFKDSMLFFKPDGTILSSGYQNMRYEHWGTIITTKNGRKGLIDIDNNVLIDFRYDNLEYARHNNFMIAESQGMLGIIDQTDSVIVPFIFQQIIPTLGKVEGIHSEFIVQKGDKLGSIALDVSTDSMKFIIPIHYDAISGWCCGGPDGHYIVKNQKEGFIYKDGQIVIPPIYDGLYSSPGGYTVRVGNKLGVVNHKNDTVIPIEYDLIYADFTHFLVRPSDTLNDKFVTLRNKEWQYFSEKGNIIKQPVDSAEIKLTYPYLIGDSEAFSRLGASCLIRVKR